MTYCIVKNNVIPYFGREGLYISQEEAVNTD